MRVNLKIRVGVSVADDYDVDENQVCGCGFAGPVLLCCNRKTGKTCAVKTYNKRSKT